MNTFNNIVCKPLDIQWCYNLYELFFCIMEKESRTDFTKETLIEFLKLFTRKENEILSLRFTFSLYDWAKKNHFPFLLVPCFNRFCYKALIDKNDTRMFFKMDENIKDYFENFLMNEVSGKEDRPYFVNIKDLQENTIEYNNNNNIDIIKKKHKYCKNCESCKKKIHEKSNQILNNGIIYFDKELCILKNHKISGIEMINEMKQIMKTFK